MATPSPEHAEGLTTAHTRSCPVCLAAPGEQCTTKVTMRPRDKSQPPVPIVLSGPHFERVRPDWVDEP